MSLRIALADLIAQPGEDHFARIHDGSLRGVGQTRIDRLGDRLRPRDQRVVVRRHRLTEQGIHHLFRCPLMDLGIVHRTEDRHLLPIHRRSSVTIMGADRWLVGGFAHRHALAVGADDDEFTLRSRLRLDLGRIARH